MRTKGVLVWFPNGATWTDLTNLKRLLLVETIGDAEVGGGGGNVRSKTGVAASAPDPAKSMIANFAPILRCGRRALRQETANPLIVNVGFIRKSKNTCADALRSCAELQVLCNDLIERISQHRYILPFQ